MSNSNNPQSVGLLSSPSIYENLFFNVSNTLTTINPEDTYAFSFPSGDDFEQNLAEVRLVYDFSTYINNEIEPLSLSLGLDSNSNGSFEIPSELIGASAELTDITNDVILIGDIISDIDIDSSFLSSDNNYFLELETQVADNNFYDIDFYFNTGFVGEIDTNDSAYCCDDNEKYYYDDLTGLTLTAGQDGLLEGDRVDIALLAQGFEPVIFVSNYETGEIIEVEANFQQGIVGDSTIDISILNDLIIEANTTYLISVETAQPGQTGDYLVDIEF